MNRELKTNLEQNFVGINAATADDEDIRSFTINYLLNKTATKLEDNLIISFRDVVVTRKGNDVTINYGFVPNGAINRLFVTGVMFNIGN
jgi:hypothetical protein